LALDKLENSGYILARMSYEILFAPEAIQDFKRLSARDRTIVRDAIETHLRFQPGKISRSRIKRLRGLRRPEYRLRIGDFRVFYDVGESWVEILAIVSKSDIVAWLKKVGENK
jgi:mRNA-degrading endonuclease RelE of RelBE toxin-antitoxin system